MNCNKIDQLQAPLLVWRFKPPYFQKKRDTDTHLKHCSKRKQWTLGILSLECWRSSDCNLSLCRHLHFFDLSRWRCWFCCLQRRVVWHVEWTHGGTCYFCRSTPKILCIAHWFQPRGNNISQVGSCRHAGKRFLHVLQIENTAYLCTEKCKPIGTTMFVRERGWLPVFHSPSISKLDLVICFRSWHCAFWVGYPILKGVIKMDVKQMGEYYYCIIMFIKDILQWLKWNAFKRCSWDSPYQRVLPGIWTSMNHSTKTLWQSLREKTWVNYWLLAPRARNCGKAWNKTDTRIRSIQGLKTRFRLNSLQSWTSCRRLSTRNDTKLASWWFQTIWKNRQIGSFPQVRVKINNNYLKLETTT